MDQRLVDRMVDNTAGIMVVIRPSTMVLIIREDTKTSVDGGEVVVVAWAWEFGEHRELTSFHFPFFDCTEC